MNTQNKKPKIHLWVPELFSFKGGIQVFSQFLAQALVECVGRENVLIISKGDSPQAIPEEGWSGITIKCAGGSAGAAGKARFAALCMGNALLECPDLIISTHLNFSVLARKLNRLKHTPYWPVAHGIDAWGLTHPGRIAALRGADRILAVSTYTRSRVSRELGIPEDKIDILPNTFDASRFSPGDKPARLLKKYGLKPDSKIILTVARLTDVSGHKGHVKLIDALPSILQHVPTAHYIIVGKGEDRANLEAYIRGKGLEHHVTLAGFVEDAELPDHYRLCDVFALPSKGEGFGIVFLEAMATGTPVIAGNRDGSVDPLRNGELGVLVDPDNTRELAEAVSGVLRGSHPLDILYHPAELREKAIEHFGRQAFQKRVKHLLNEHTENQ